MNSEHNTSGPDGVNRPRATRYDLVLAAFPLVFALAMGGGIVLNISHTTAIGAAAVVGLGLLAEVLFRNPPIRPPRRPETN